jgi:hypothetical protein
VDAGEIGVREGDRVQAMGRRHCICVFE